MSTLRERQLASTKALATPGGTVEDADRVNHELDQRGREARAAVARQSAQRGRTKAEQVRTRVWPGGKAR